MIVTLAGHVDHGKTAIVKALTGIETDRLEEERRRGLTIDLGFAYCDLGSERVGFVDVPGHHRFIHNMIAGVAEHQHALLIVAADDGVMPQTKEHLQILTLMGLRHGTIVLNKIDLVSEERKQEVREDISALVANSSLRDVEIVEVSATNGAGVAHLTHALTDAALQFRKSESERCFRLAVDRSFSPRGVGTVVTGTVHDGNLTVGQQLTLSDPLSTVRVRSLVVNGIDSESASAGDRCGVQISDARASDVPRGAWLRDPDAFSETQHLTLLLDVIDDFPRTVKNWSPIHVYHATSHAQGRLALLEGQLQAGDTGFVDLNCSTPLQVCVGDRLVVRDHDLQRTLGGGLVVSTTLSAGRRRSEQRLSVLLSTKPAIQRSDFVDCVVRRSQHEVVDLETHRRAWNLPQTVLEDVKASNNFIVLEGKALHTKYCSKLESQLLEIAERFHTEFPNSTGLRTDQFQRDGSFQNETLNFVLQKCVAEAKLELNGAKFSLPGRSPQLSDYDSKLYEQVLPLIDIHQPKTTGDVAKLLKVPLRELEREMARFAKAQLLVQVSPRRYFTRQKLIDLAEKVQSIGENGSFTVRDVRDASNIGRMVIIDVLEYFDRQRFTQRHGDQRILIGSAEKIV